MNTLHIQNALVVTPTAVLPNTSIWVENGIITHIGNEANSIQAKQTIDATGCIVLPGIIDIHTDALDMEIVPRPGADIPIPIAFRELERKMSGCGFTTVYHSLHLGYEVAEANARSKYKRNEIFEAVHQACHNPSLINNKIHLRFELTGVSAYNTCLELISKGYISLLSVMDHTPGQGQFSRQHFVKAMIKSGKTEEQAIAEYEVKNSRPKIKGEQLQHLINHARNNNIPVASHDDDTIEKVDAMQQLGVTICEFPINLQTAHHATNLGMHVAGGASNILRGGSLSGNVCITDAVRKGAVDTLCSDYYPSSILHSIFKLHHQENLPLNETANLASLHPAKAAGINSFTGSIETGKHADLLVVRMVNNLPMLTHTLVKGTIVNSAALKN